MSKGGGGGTTVQYDQLPEYVQPYLERILETGEDKYIKPYTEYTGDRIADEAPQRDIVNSAIEELASVGSPYFGEAMDGQRGIIRQYEEPQEFSAESAQRYMDPFLDQVLSRQKAGLLSDYEAQTAKSAKSAIGAGAFGGSRQAVLEAEREKGLLNRLADVEATGRQDAYKQAQGLFSSDRDYRLQALGAKGASLAGLAGLGERSQSSLLERLRQLEGVGKADEARRQVGLDQAYEEFQRQEAYPTEQLERFSALIRGIPLPSQRITENSVSTNPYQQLLGLGITGLQLKDLMS